MASTTPEITVAPDANPTPNAPAQTAPSKPAAKKVAVAPPGYKLVKVRKPDGTIVTVKRKLSPEELAATSPAASPSNAALTTTTISDATTTTPSKATTTTTSNATTTTRNIDSKPEASAVAAVPKSPAASPQSSSSPTVAKSPSVEAAAATSPVTTEVTQAMLDEQTAAFREKRMSRFKNGMIRGLTNVIAHSFPTVDIGDWHHGDEEVDYGDDDSDFDPDDDHHHDDDHHSDHHQEGNAHVTFQSGVAANAVAAAITAPPQHSAAQPRATGPAGQTAEKEKETYKVNITELNNIEQKTAEAEQPLRRHWANISFYLMASLSIVLPLMFLILGIFILLMQGKTTDSHWGKVQDAIKVAVSAWPIVFAAVVAQVFKAFATFKVERGIKLMQLEQLIGSNSFGNAMKQPILLRRLDILTLTLFLVWCLSPLGSQAVQRCIYVEPSTSTWYNQTVRYLDTTVPNQMFSAANTTSSGTNVGRATQVQLVSTYYNSAFLPPSQSRIQSTTNSYNDQDDWSNPMIPPMYNYSLSDADGHKTRYQYASAYGVSMFLPNSQAKAATATTQKQLQSSAGNVQYDITNFNMSASYYNLTCGAWKQIDYPTFDSNFNWSANFDSGFTMTDPSGQNRTHYLAFASENRNLTSTNDPTADAGNNSVYSQIECTYKQVFVAWQVSCYRDESNTAGNDPQCSNFEPQLVSNSTNYALRDFSDDFMDGTAGGGQLFLTSATEKFLLNGTLLDDPVNRDVNQASGFFNISALVSPSDFEYYFGYAFNTYLTLGFCPQCVDAGISNYSGTDRNYLYKTVKSEYIFRDHDIYQLAVPWVILYWFCCGTLLIAGIFSVWLEGMTVAPDVLGYASSVARNSKYLHLPKTNSAMGAGQRLQQLGGVKVMMQDVKADKDVGKIALGMKHEKAQRLQPNRLYR